jgi:tetratricopeptide repeat protein
VRDARWYNLPIRICLLVSLLFCIYLGARRAVGAWYFRRESPDAIQAAMKWDPANPEYYDALGTLMHLYADSGNSNEIVQLYESATRLSPHDAQFWADLGDGYDWAGRSHDALDAFQYARHLFPNSPDINWRLANFYVRAGNIPDALRTLRMVLLEDGSTARRVFTLATNATHDREAILEMLPPQAPIFFDYLNFRIEEGGISEAEEVWARVLQRDLPFDLREAFPYFDALIQHRELAQLSGTWAALTQRFPAQLQRLVVSPNLITNGGFEFDILNGGFDWRVIPTKGVVVGLDSVGAFEGSRALRITFDGSRNTDYAQVLQYVSVQANTRYRFSGHLRVQGITTDSGPRLQVCDAYNMGRLFVSTDNLVGTSGWSEQQAEFTTLTDTHLLLVRVIRPVSNKLDNQIAGTEWIDGIRLTAE